MTHIRTERTSARALACRFDNSSAHPLKTANPLQKAAFFACLAATAFFSLGATDAARADVYRWVEDDGTVNYGEREPRGRDFTVISRSAKPGKQKTAYGNPVPAPKPAQRASNVEGSFNAEGSRAANGTLPQNDNLSDEQRAMLERLQADEARRQESLAEIRKSNCATSKSVLSKMQTRGRIRMRNESGEEVAMTDADRNERIRQAQQSIAVNCDSIS